MVKFNSRGEDLLSYEGKLYVKYIYFLVLSLLLTFVGAKLSESIRNVNILILFIISIMMLLIFAFSKGFLKKIFFGMFAFVEGFTLGGIIHNYSSEKLSAAMIITIIIVLITATIGYNVKALANIRLGNILFNSLLALLVASIINIFIDMSLISIVAVIIFSIFIMHDVSRFRQDCEYGRVRNSNDILEYVMDVYLDSVNIFTDIMDIID